MMPYWGQLLVTISVVAVLLAFVVLGCAYWVMRQDPRR